MSLLLEMGAKIAARRKKDRKSRRVRVSQKAQRIFVQRHPPAKSNRDNQPLPVNVWIFKSRRGKKADNQ